MNKIVLLVITVCILLIVSSVNAQQTIEELVVTSRVPISYQNQELKTGPKTYEARQSAMNKAKRDLVEKATKNLLGEKKYTENLEKVKSLFDSAAAFIKGEEVMDEGPQGDYYSVTIKSKFDFPLLRSNLDSLGIPVDALSRRTVMLLVEEYFAEDFSPGGSGAVAEIIGRRDESYFESANELHEEYIGAENLENSEVKGGMDSKEHIQEKKDLQEISVRFFPPEVLKHPRKNSVCGAHIERIFRERDIRLVDEEMVTQFRDQSIGADGYLTDLLVDDSKAAAAALKAGKDYKADVFLVGCVSIIYEGVQGEEHTSRASLAAKVVDTSTGEILASTAFTQGGVSRNAQASANIAAERVGKLIGADLRDQIMIYWKKRMDKGKEIEIRLIGIESTRDKVQFIKALKKTIGVNHVEQRAFDRGQRLLEVVATYKGDINDFEQGFLENVYDIDAFAQLEEQHRQGRNITYVLP